MRRLTEANEQGYWNVKGLPWKNIYAGQVITEETRKIIYGCLCKLKDYEDIGPSPEQLKKIDELFSEAYKELGQLKQKVNDIGWIPCSERFPENEGMYLITSKVLDKTEIQYVFYQPNIGMFICNGTPLAWMPLPEPYREEDANE